MRPILFFALVTSVCLSSLNCQQMCQAAERHQNDIQPYAKNRYYWQYKGKPVLLLGGSVEDNLFQIPKIAEHLELLKKSGGNYVRNTMSSRDKGNVWPFLKVNGKYDLNRWNPEYWKRFETFLSETAKRDIIVQIEIWATFDYYRDPWSANPFNPKNNINYTTQESKLKTRVPSHPLRLENPFVRSIKSEQNLPVVLKYQEKFVGKILDHTLKYSHVLYCMDNETAASPAWSAHWSRFILQRAKQAGKTVHTTEMVDPWNILDRRHNRMFHHPELYSFLDISQNNHMKGQKHYDNPLKRRRSIAKNPRPLNCVKVYGADTGRFGKTKDGLERFWRNIFCGLAATRFHRPDSGLGLSPLAQHHIAAAREVTNSFNIFTTAPHNDLLSRRESNEAYCLANPGREYAVYFPNGGDVSLKLSPQKRAVSLKWYDVNRKKWTTAKPRISNGQLVLKTPGKGMWVAVIQRTGKGS
ncbi:MAG: hypothetical protein Tsb009_19800 [Planctomycetaceae bacterium]